MLERNNLFVGIVLLIVGGIFLARNYGFMPNFFQIGKMWPLFVILVGLFFIFARKRSDN